MNEEEFVVSEQEGGTRLDRFLAVRISDVSRSQFRKWLDQGLVTVDGVAVKPSSLLKPGSRVRLNRPEPLPSTLLPEAIPIHIVHEDEDILVLSKPAGLTVHPGAGRRQGTLAHGLLNLHPERIWPGPPERPGIVHRLDRLTSGLMVVACSGRGYLDLQGQIARRELSRGYIALCWGCPSSASGTIEAPIGRDLRDRKRMAVVRRGGRPAKTHFRLLQRLDPLSLIELRLETGRTHQIRVHMAHIGLPVFGDPVYGGGRVFLSRVSSEDRGLWSTRLRRLNRQALHAYHLALRHPRDGRPWVFEAPVPEEIETLLMELLEGAAPGEE